MVFEFTAPTRIVFGRGALQHLGAIAQPLGRRAFVVRGGDHLDRSGALDRVKESLAACNVACVFHVVRGEPELRTINDAVDAARDAACDLVIGLGGGSVIDAAKAVAGMLTNGGRVSDYLEVIGQGKTISVAAAPMVAIPTTAGTGSEVTRNAVIASPEQHFKASVRSPHLLPTVALVDPALTDSLPPALTASTGLDAWTQVIEPYVSNKAGPLTDPIALRGVALTSRALPRAFDDGSDMAARDDMAMASLMGGLCLANAGLGAVHGIAAPLGASFSIPHGIACAALLPHVMAANVRALRDRSPSSPALARYADLAGAIVGQPDATIDAAIEHVAAMVRRLGVPGLSRFGVTAADLPEVAANARRASSMRYNPVELGVGELAGCLHAAL